MKAAAFFRMIVTVGVLFSAGTAAAQQNSMPVNNGAWEHCGCDTKEGIEMFVGNLVNEARQRDAVCESAATHIPFCIAAWCSTCAGHENAVENCVETANNYLADTTESCTQHSPDLFTLTQKIPDYPL